MKITDILLDVDAWTGFGDCFTHRRSGRPADDRNALLTVILADGINLGLTRMADSCRGASLRQLAHLHDWHISEAAYGEALGRLIEAHRATPLAGLWGSGISSSSDGQQFHAGGRGAAISDINARNGNEPGVSFYTHISDQYDPFGSRVIAATAGEAPYVLDGLLYHQTGLSIEEHYTDTGGAVIIWTINPTRPFIRYYSGARWHARFPRMPSSATAAGGRRPASKSASRGATGEIDEQRIDPADDTLVPLDLASPAALAGIFD